MNLVFFFPQSFRHTQLWWKPYMDILVQNSCFSLPSWIFSYFSVILLYDTYGVPRIDTYDIIWSYHVVVCWSAFFDRSIESICYTSSFLQMEPLHFDDHDVVKPRARLSFPQPRGRRVGLRRRGWDPGRSLEKPWDFGKSLEKQLQILHNHWAVLVKSGEHGKNMEFSCSSWRGRWKIFGNLRGKGGLNDGNFINRTCKNGECQP